MEIQDNSLGFLFDLDQTLVDSRICAKYRKMRNWPTVYSMIPSIKIYPGIQELFRTICDFDNKICVITSSPTPYCKRVISHFHLNVNATVCYHDTGLHKPYPEPINEGLRRLGIKSSRAYSIGDAVQDIIASKTAGVFSIAALWGADDSDSLIRSKPDYICNSVDDLQKYCVKVMTAN